MCAGQSRCVSVTVSEVCASCSKPPHHIILLLVTCCNWVNGIATVAQQRVAHCCCWVVVAVCICCVWLPWWGRDRRLQFPAAGATSVLSICSRCTLVHTLDSWRLLRSEPRALQLVGDTGATIWTGQLLLESSREDVDTARKRLAQRLALLEWAVRTTRPTVETVGKTAKLYVPRKCMDDEGQLKQWRGRQGCAQFQLVLL